MLVVIERQAKIVNNTLFQHSARTSLSNSHWRHHGTFLIRTAVRPYTVIYRKLPLISPGLIQLHKGHYMDLQMEGLISEGAYNRSKKTLSKRAIAVLIEIRISFTGF